MKKKLTTISFCLLFSVIISLILVNGVRAVTFADPLGKEGNLITIANTLIKGALGVTGVLALIAFIWGGIEWLISAGDTKRIQKGKDMMTWAVLGLLVIFGSYAILNLVFTILSPA